MSLINSIIPGLYGGVSQQTPELRHKTQVTEMINVYPTIIGGVQKRPPLQHYTMIIHFLLIVLYMLMIEGLVMKNI